MNQQPESKQKIEPEHYYRCSYKPRKRLRELFAEPQPKRRLAGTYIGLAEDVPEKKARQEIIGLVTGCCLFVTLITLVVAWNRFGIVESNDFITALIKTLITLPFPFFMLCYRAKSDYGSILQLCGLIVPITVTVISCILCLAEPTEENGILLILMIRRVAIFGTLIYALLQTIALCAHHFYKKYKQD